MHLCFVFLLLLSRSVLIICISGCEKKIIEESISLGLTESRTAGAKVSVIHSYNYHASNTEFAINHCTELCCLSLDRDDCSVTEVKKIEEGTFDKYICTLYSCLPLEKCKWNYNPLYAGASYITRHMTNKLKKRMKNNIDNALKQKELDHNSPKSTSITIQSTTVSYSQPKTSIDITTSQQRTTLQSKSTPDMQKTTAFVQHTTPSTKESISSSTSSIKNTSISNKVTTTTFKTLSTIENEISFSNNSPSTLKITTPQQSDNITTNKILTTLTTFSSSQTTPSQKNEHSTTDRSKDMDIITSANISKVITTSSSLVESTAKDIPESESNSNVLSTVAASTFTGKEINPTKSSSDKNGNIDANLLNQKSQLNKEIISDVDQSNDGKDENANNNIKNSTTVLPIFPEIIFAHKYKKETYSISAVSSILAASLLLIIAAGVIIGKLCFDSWKHRHYHHIDYLIEGMYND